MRLRWPRTLAAALLSLLPVVASVQAAGGISRVGPFYTDRPDEVTVVLELRSDLPASPIAQDLHLLEDGESTAVAREIRSFEDSGRGLALLLCVDISGTMAPRKGQDPLGDVKNALLDFSARLRPQDQVALMVFGTDSEVVSPFGNEREALQQQIRQLQAETRGDTLLYTALYNALDNLLGAPNLPRRQRIIVISDGKDEGSHETQDTIARIAQRQAVPIDAIAYGRIPDQFAASLNGLASRTRGQFVHARPDLIRLPDALSLIFNYLTSRTSLVAHFDYADPSMLRTDSATIDWRPGESTEPLPDKAVPIVREESPLISTPPATPARSWWQDPLWVGLLLAGLLLALLIVAFLRWKGKGDAGLTAPPATAPRSQPAVPPSVEPSDRHPPLKRTRVSGYFPSPLPGKPTARLEGTEGPVTGRSFAVEKPEVTIGADATNDLQINDDYLSGVHAQLSYKSGNLYLTDLDSRNGTFVNENRLSKGAVTLKPGDRIRIGQSHFTLVSGGS